MIDNLNFYKSNVVDNFEMYIVLYVCHIVLCCITVNVIYKWVLYIESLTMEFIDFLKTTIILTIQFG